MTRTLQQTLDALDDPGGAACVVRDGEIADEGVTGTLDGARPWATDTLVMTYSCAKPFAALTVLTAVADGALGLDQPVADLWPSYAAHGKQATTVRHVLAHQAGLPAFPEEAAEVAFDDRDALVNLLAEATPVHEPGAACAEHALTYGHLCDQLVRLATGEELADRFARIAAEHGWDLHLRVAGGDLGRVADPVAVEPDWPARYTDDPRWGPAMTRPVGLLDPAVLGSERWRTTSFPAIGLHASARGLATFYGQLMDEDGPVAQLLGPDAAPRVPRPSGHRPRPAPGPRGHVDARLPDRRPRHRDGRSGRQRCLLVVHRSVRRGVRLPRARHPRPRRGGLRAARRALRRGSLIDPEDL